MVNIKEINNIATKITLKSWNVTVGAMHNFDDVRICKNRSKTGGNNMTESQNIKTEEHMNMLKELSETILAKMTEERGDAILFIIVNLINRVGPDRIFDRDDLSLEYYLFC